MPRGSAPSRRPPKQRLCVICDYSLTHVKSRAAEVGDKLVTKNFGMGTVGLCPEKEAEAGVLGYAATAVCIRPGTELAFEGKIKRRWSYENQPEEIAGDPRTAIFRQINKDTLTKHHDCLEFPNGQQLLLTLLEEGQIFTVLQLPAAPKTEAEAKDQERLAVVA